MNRTHNGKVRLDIACGKRKKRGFLGVDIWEGADLICDLERFPWPFDDCSVDEIYCSHYIEHTPDLIAFMNEVYRVLKPGAKAEFFAPYYSSIRAWQDPTHLRAISEATFLYFNAEWRTANQLDHYGITADFDISCSYYLASDWRQREPEELKFAMRHYINVVQDIQAVLTKRAPVNEAALKLARKATGCWERGQIKRALSLARESIDLASTCMALLVIAEHEHACGNYRAAAESFSQALELDRESLEAHAGLMRSLGADGRRSEVRKLLDRTRKYNSDFASILEMYLPPRDGKKRGLNAQCPRLKS